ncbi:MAG: hypothetical protein GTO24_21175 [candidate division Zixibacteria bacterium]|nr:hypothetical protein [candidate division Zixibacteria bacterium]
MLRITAEEYRIILEALSDKYPGHGYADDPKIARLQAKLSMMLEAAVRVENPRDCDSCATTGLLCPIRNQDEFSFPCPHWKPVVEGEGA